MRGIAVNYGTQTVMRDTQPFPPQVYNTKIIDHYPFRRNSVAFLEPRRRHQMRQDVNVYSGVNPKWFNVVHAVERCKRTQEVFFFCFFVGLFALILHWLRTKLQDLIPG